MTNCNECGIPLAEEDAFCPNCGAATGKPRIQAPKTVMDIPPAPFMQQPVQPMQPMMQQPMMQQPMQPVMQQPVQPFQPVMQQQEEPLRPILQGPQEPIQLMDWQRSAAIKNRAENRNYAVAIKVLLVISCVLSAMLYLLPLLWCLPVTIIAWQKLDREEPLGFGLKLCTFLFVSKIAGILMFIMKDETRYVQY